MSTSVVPLFSDSPCEFSGAAVMPLREHFSGALVSLVLPLFSGAAVMPLREHFNGALVSLVVPL